MAIFCSSFYYCRKFATVKQRVWRSMCKSIHFSIYIRKPHVFFTIGDDGSRQYRSVSPIFVRVLRFWMYNSRLVEYVSHKSSMNSLQYIFPVIKNLHKKTLCSFSTIGDDGSRQYRWESPIFVRVLRIWMYNSRLVENCSHKSSMNSLQYIFHDFFENNSEICIQYIFHDFFPN